MFRMTSIAAGALTMALGGAAEAADEKPLLKDFMGINAHTVQFNPKLYSPVCRLVRDFHPSMWDFNDKPGTPTNFPMAMHINWEDKSGKFRSWNAPINWQTIYSSWKQEGFEINACLMVDGVKYADWPNVEKDVYEYGKAFASYFGPSNHDLVTAAEIANEPAHDNKYSPEQYKTLLRNMSRGLREGDPKLQIVTCAVQYGPGDGFCQPIEVLRGENEHYDVINLHQYALLHGWPSFERTYPEDARFDFIGRLASAVNWRNENAPGKPIWLTEFGFDASTQQPEPNNKDWKSSTDLQQAQWIVRSFLTVSEIDVDRAYLYWFDDNDRPSFHAASGITRFMTPKPSYWAMKHLYESLGDYRFARAITKSDNAWVYEFSHGQDASKVVWVAWSPTGADRTGKTQARLPGKLVKAEAMPLVDGKPAAVQVEDEGGNAVIPISESPVYLWIEK